MDKQKGIFSFEGVEDVKEEESTINWGQTGATLTVTGCSQVHGITEIAVDDSWVRDIADEQFHSLKEQLLEEIRDELSKTSS